MGSRRMVWLVGRYAIKFPILTGWVSFLAGLRENLEERYWWCTEDGPHRQWPHPNLGEILWADRFGFCLVMRRYENYFDTTMTPLQWTRKVTEYVNQRYAANSQKRPPCFDDLEEYQFGWDGEKMVLLDYGYFGGMQDCYLGCPKFYCTWWRRITRVLGRLFLGKPRPEPKVDTVALQLVGTTFWLDCLSVSNALEVYRSAVARDLPAMRFRTDASDNPERCFVLRVSYDDGKVDYLHYVAERLDSSPKGAAFRNHGELGGRWVVALPPESLTAQ